MTQPREMSTTASTKGVLKSQVVGGSPNSFRMAGHPTFCNTFPASRSVEFWNISLFFENLAVVGIVNVVLQHYWDNYYDTTAPLQSTYCEADGAT